MTLQQENVDTLEKDSTVEWRDGLDLARMIRDKSVSPREAVEDVIARAGRVNPKLNAICETLYDSARAAADVPLTGDAENAPFAGVPTYIKDLFMPLQGVKMTNGSELCRAAIAPVDGTLIARMRKAGFGILGTTASPEFGTSFATESKLHGITRNPWSPDHTPGGSSGGAAALVAARVLPIAHGNDGGGSLRVPASCCGVFGLKPSRGRVPIGPMVGEGWGGMGINHVITLSVRDSAAVLDATAGMEPGAPYAAPQQGAGFLTATQTPPRALRIGRVDGLAPWPTDPECIEAVNQSAKLCEELGHTVVPIALPVDAWEFYHNVFNIIGAQTKSFLNLVAMMSGQPTDLELLEARTRVILREKGDISGATYAASIDWIHAFGRQMAHVMSGVDVLLMPTLAKPPVKTGALDLDDSASFKNLVTCFHSFSPLTPLFNASGQPAMSVPLHWSPEGLPIGTQFAAGFGQEELLFALAAQLEEARPWAGRRPPICAI